jgi:hypothetical protein
MLSSKPPTPARLAQWAALRAAGKDRYVRYHGLLKTGSMLFIGFGGWLYLVHSGLLLLITGTELPVPLPVSGGFWLVLLAVAAACYTIGYVGGKSQWNRNEEWYQYYTTQQQHLARHDAE